MTRIRTKDSVLQKWLVVFACWIKEGSRVEPIERLSFSTGLRYAEQRNVEYEATEASSPSEVELGTAEDKNEAKRDKISSRSVPISYDHDC